MPALITSLFFEFLEYFLCDNKQDPSASLGTPFFLESERCFFCHISREGFVVQANIFSLGVSVHASQRRFALTTSLCVRIDIRYSSNREEPKSPLIYPLFFRRASANSPPCFSGNTSRTPQHNHNTTTAHSTAHSTAHTPSPLLLAPVVYM